MNYYAEALNQRRRDRIESLIRKYRNANKRDYALRYANWIMAGAAIDEPTSGLSTMGRQAVRFDIARIFREEQ